MKNIILIVSILMNFMTIDAFAGTNDSEQAKVGWLKKSLNKLTWEQLVEVADSPENICKRVKDRVKYVADDEDKMKSAPETWESGTGDCEDFANCIVALCKAKGFETWIEVYFENNNQTGHAVAMGKINGRLWMASNGTFKFVNTDENASVAVAAEMGWHRGQIIHRRWEGNLENTDTVIAGR